MLTGALLEEDGAATVATDLPLKLSKDDIKGTKQHSLHIMQCYSQYT